MTPPPLILEAPNGRSTSVSLRCSLGRSFVKDAFGIPDPTISRDHCQIQWRGRHYWIRDGSSDGLNSLLGTFLDGIRLPHGSWHPIPSITSLRIGETNLTLTYEELYSTEYDLMISYSRKDQEAVLGIEKQMREIGLRPWLDQYSNRPATHYLKDIEKIMTETNAVAVFWGGDHMGDTQAAEVEVVTALHIHRKIRSVFLIVLPGSQNPQWGAFLSNIDYYDLRKPAEMDRLMRDLHKKLSPEDG